MMPRRTVLVLVACLGLSALSSCRAIELNYAMERVHLEYLRLFREVELRDEAGMRTAAQGLLYALDDPAVTGYSSDEEYRDLLAESAESVRYFAEVTVETGDGGDTDDLVKARKRVFGSCDACHRTYRR